MNIDQKIHQALPEITPKLLILFFLWLSSICSIFILQIVGLIPWELVPPEFAHLFTVEAQLVFVVGICPLFFRHFQEILNTSYRRKSNREPDSIDHTTQQQFWWHGFFTLALTMVLFSFPLVFMTAEISNVSWETLVLLQLVVVSFLIGTGLVWCAAEGKFRNWLPPYYFIVMTLSVGMPGLHVLIDQVTGNQIQELLFLSPFTSIVLTHNEGMILPVIIQMGIFLLGGGIGVWLVRKFAPAPSPLARTGSK